MLSSHSYSFFFSVFVLYEYSPALICSYNQPMCGVFWDPYCSVQQNERFPVSTGMWRLTLLFAAPRRSSPTVDPEVCLLGFLWRDLTWSNAKTPTGSAFGGNLSLCLNQVMASMSGCFWSAGSTPETSAPQAFWTETWSRRTSVPTFTASWRNILRPTRPTGPAKTCGPRSRRPLFYQSSALW